MIAGCAISAGVDGTSYPKDAHWQGRLLLKVHTDPVQAFSASFDLQGDAQAGQLSFFTPLGSTAARLQWDARGARLQTTGDVRTFESLDALTYQATGAVLPVASLFAWLTGQDRPTPGWQADLQELPNGRLTAKRLAPETPAELKIILEP